MSKQRKLKESFQKESDQFLVLLEKGLEIGRNHNDSLLKDLVRCSQSIWNKKPYKVVSEKTRTSLQIAINLQEKKSLQKEVRNFITKVKNRIRVFNQEFPKEMSEKYAHLMKILLAYEDSPAAFCSAKKTIFEVEPQRMTQQA